jgi:superfamily I DNA/RNA helicase
MQVALSKQLFSTFDAAPGPVRKQIFKMIELFKTDPNHPSLHREHYHQQADPRAQTIRVNEGLRAVILKGENGFVIVDVLSHDDADRWMANTKVSTNVLTGALELVDISVVQAAEAELSGGATSTDGGLFDRVSDKDFGHLGVDPAIVSLLRVIRTQEQLDPLTKLMPEMQAMAVILLAEGNPVDDTYRIVLDLIDAMPLPLASPDTEAPVDGEEPGGEQVDVPPTPIAVVASDDPFEAAMSRASSSQFAIAANDAEMEEMLAQPWAVWRVCLHPKQKSMVQRNYSGSAKVSGGPGTGKTVVAIHRAVELARRNPDAPILLTTFTTTLAADLQHLLRALSSEGIENIEVLNIDKLVARVLNETGAQRLRPASEAEVDALFEDARNEVGLQQSDSFARHEWEQVVLAGGISSRAEYFNAPRPGRGVRLNRAERAQVWEVIDLVTSRLAKAGMRTFLQSAADAAELAARAAGRERYVHIVVDEAQDLHPAHWKLLRASVGKHANDIFITADAQQRIYDRKVVLSRYGINVRGRASTLRLNYRSTAQIVRWAKGVLSGATADDLDSGSADTRGYWSAMSGPVPMVEGYPSSGAEAEAVCEHVKALVGAGTKADEIVVSARTRSTVEMLATRLRGAGLSVHELSDGANSSPDAVQLATFHRMKGLEFRHVVLAGVTDGVVPLVDAITSDADDPRQRAEDLAREQSLLFVAATRARDSLLVTFHGSPSRFLP